MRRNMQLQFIGVKKSPFGIHITNYFNEKSSDKTLNTRLLVKNISKNIDRGYNALKEIKLIVYILLKQKKQ